MNKELDYNEPISIGDGIYWVGFCDEERNLHCNPYCILEGDEAVIIDSGSRTDFSTVMTKILKTGLELSQVTYLIYQHYDPDLCSSIPHFEQFVDKRKVNLISHKENNVFIRYYAGTLKMLCIESLHFEMSFATGRKLTFYRTPYTHSAGSFVTFDEQTGTLFSSDIFGAYDKKWQLFTELKPGCRTCGLPEDCPEKKEYCPLKGIYAFHQRIMTSRRALSYAMEVIKTLPITQIAPQHGGILREKSDIDFLIAGLSDLEGVGIDGIV